MASPSVGHKSESSSDQDKDLVVDHQEQAIFPVSPRLLEEDHGQDMRAEEEENETIDIPASNTEGHSDGADVKAEEAAVDEVEDPNGVCDTDVNSGVEEKHHMNSFTSTESLPLNSETESVQVREHEVHVKEDQCLSENGSCLESMAQGLSSPSWHSEPVASEPVATLARTVTGQAKFHEQYPCTSWDQVEEELPELPPPPINHNLPSSLNPYSLPYTPLDESHAAAHFPPATPIGHQSQSGSESVYGLREPYSHPLSALTFEYPHERHAFPSHPSQLSPYGFEKPITPSTTPSDAHSGEMRVPYPNGAALSSMPSDQLVISTSPSSESATNFHMHSLVLHTIQHFNDPEYADCDLLIRVGNDAANLKLHALVIGQSPILKATMLSSASSVPETSMKQLELCDSGEFGSVAAFIAALRVLYGESPLVAIDKLHEGTNDADTTPLDMAIAYMFAGHTLGSTIVEHVGLSALMANISLDGLGKLFAYAMSGNANFTNKYLVSFSSDNPAHVHMIRGALQFLATNFPSKFKLDIRVPSVTEFGAPCYHPGYSPIGSHSTISTRLSTMSLGSMPLVEDPTISKDSTMVSKILLSLSDCEFGRFARMARGLVRRGIIMDVQEEREKRFGGGN